jgi:hypothetical protein
VSKIKLISRSKYLGKTAQSLRKVTAQPTDLQKAATFQMGGLTT